MLLQCRERMNFFTGCMQGLIDLCNVLKWLPSQSLTPVYFVVEISILLRPYSMREKIITVLICLISIGHSELCHAQNQQHRIDSLLQVLKPAKEDTGKANTLNALSKEFWLTSDYDKAKKYADDALQLSEKINYEKGQAYAYLNIATTLWYQGDFPIALENITVALKISEKINDKKGIAGGYFEIGNIYSSKGNYPDALKNYYTSLKILEETGDKLGIAGCYINIGIIYYMQRNFPDALKKYLSALKIQEEIKDKFGITIAYNNIGEIYWSQGNYPEALKNYFAVLKIQEEIGYKHGASASYNNIGDIYYEQGNYPDALKNLFVSLKIREEIKNKADIRRSYVNIGLTYIKLQKIPEAKKYLNDALALSEEIGNKDDFMESYGSLAKLDSAVGNSKQALEHYKLYSLYKDSLLNETSSKQLNEMNSKYESEKKDNEIALLTKDKQIQKAEIGKQKFLKNAFIGGLALALILAFFAYRSYRTRQLLKLQTLRNKIASDLHDEVGSTLSSIRIFSELARQQSKEVQPMLDQIGESSRNMLESMADIVWTINPENDNFEKIILRMRSFAYELLGAKKIDFKFEADDAVNKMNLPMDVRKNLYMIFKEATNNMAKYAEADRASFYLKETNNNLSLLIRDNGKGFDMNQPTQGNGLKNMKKRAEEMDAELLIESIPGSGTTIQLIFKAA